MKKRQEKIKIFLLSFFLLGYLFIGACSLKKDVILKPPNHGNVYVVAHRGAHNGIPENTLPAYQKAIDLGADFVEIDVRTTKDGQYVSIHNSTIDAYVDGGTGPVKDFTLQELRALDIGSRVGPEWKDVKIPTFEEILDLCKDRIGIYLDLKQAPVAPLIDMIKERCMEKQVLWYADDDELAQVQERCPNCIIMPDPGPEENIIPVIKRLSPMVIAPVWRHFTKNYVELGHNNGVIVIVDERDQNSWEQALEWKVDGIQTDYPEKLIEFLQKNRN